MACLRTETPSVACIFPNVLVTLVSVRSLAVVLLNNSFVIVGPIVCGWVVLGPCFVMQYLVFFLVCNHLAEDERVM